MNSNRSVATIDAPEFINVEPFNPTLSTCEIKVLYLGENRNHSYIDKNTAIQMANSLPGVPIVGAFREEIQDFGDHGHVVKIEDGEIKFACKTRPYGFVAPDAKVWFKKFIDTDELGNDIVREYLMTTGYLWTSQYKEALQCIEEGKGQSMELDGATLDGHWATNNNSGIDFFIINDAIFTKLCILGDDVKPCFEGASVTSPEVSNNFTQDVEFQKTLFTMMNELKQALQNKGGSDMEVESTESEFTVEQEATDDATENIPVEFEDSSDGGDADAGTSDNETNDTDDNETNSDGDDNEPNPTPEEPDDDDEEVTDDDDDDPLRKLGFSLEDYQKLQQDYALLEEEVKSLREFKMNIENQQKDAIINKYFMLDDADKAEIIEHKSEYSIEDIESKLALIYVKKNVDFNVLDTTKEEEPESESLSVTFSLDDNNETDAVPAWVEALRQVKK